MATVVVVEVKDRHRLDLFSLRRPSSVTSSSVSANKKGRGNKKLKKEKGSFENLFKVIDFWNKRDQTQRVMKRKGVN